MSRPSCLVITGPKTLPQLQNLPSALRSPRELTDNTEEGFTIRVCPDRKLLAKARPPESPFSSSSQTGCHKVPWGQINTADPQKKKDCVGLSASQTKMGNGQAYPEGLVEGILCKPFLGCNASPQACAVGQ